jgi:hypothetical protein
MNSYLASQAKLVNNGASVGQIKGTVAGKERMVQQQQKRLSSESLSMED